MAALDCVINHTKLTYDENYYDIGRNSVQLTFSLPYPHTWDFFENGDWVQKGDVSARGRWVCDGDRDYKITNTLGEVFSSKIAVWLSSPKSDPKFYCVSNAAYHAEIFKNVKKLRGQNSLTIMRKNATWVFNADKTFLGKAGENAEGHNYGGTWKCLGNNTFEIIDKESGAKWIDNGKGWVKLDSTFSCVANYFNDNKKPFTFSSDKLVRVFGSVPVTRFFYKSKQFVDMKTIDGKPVIDKSGTWECDGERDYKLISKKSGVFSSKTGTWIDAPITPEQTEEPTYDKSKFPLGLGSEGPEVAQLQNYLNKLIPFEPLVVNGRFDKKTQDKLIQLQKSLNLTK